MVVNVVLMARKQLQTLEIQQTCWLGNATDGQV
jgi:hypothetical protein